MIILKNTGFDVSLRVWQQHGQRRLLFRGHHFESRKDGRQGEGGAGEANQQEEVGGRDVVQRLSSCQLKVLTTVAKLLELGVSSRLS